MIWRWAWAGDDERIVRVRPRKLQWWTVAAAVMIAAVFAVSATTQPGTTAGGGRIFAHEGWSLAGVGVLLGAVALTPLRIRVVADAERILIFNLVGDYALPWSAVRSVRYQHGTPWASLELHNGDLVAMLAVQIFDGEHAVAAVRRLRALHAAGQAAGQAWER